MANIQFANNAAGTIAANLSSSATSLPFAYAANSSTFPTVSAPTYFMLTFVDQYSFANGINPPQSLEIVKVTLFSGSGNMTITRGQEGTVAKVWSIGDRMENRLTSGGLANAIAGT